MRSWVNRLSVARLHKPTLVGEHHGLYAVAHAELAENACHVRLDGSLGEEQLLPDLQIGQATREQPQHLELPATCLPTRRSEHRASRSRRRAPSNEKRNLAARVVIDAGRVGYRDGRIRTGDLRVPNAAL